MQTTIVILGLILALLAFINSAMHLNESGADAEAKARPKAKPRTEPQIRVRPSTRAAGTSVSL
jgi:hypothetical protein